MRTRAGSPIAAAMDGWARTSTELAAVAGVSASTASIDLDRLRTANLVEVLAQGRHRYYGWPTGVSTTGR